MCDFSQYDGASDEWLAVAATLPAVPTAISILERRDATNAVREAAAAASFKTLKPWLAIADHTIPTRDGSTVEARTYRLAGLADSEPLPVYIHLHGGGFLFGTLASEDAICARIAINTRAIVLNVNYRHTPEHTYPTAWNDLEDAFSWLHENIALLNADPARVVVGGISAGASLAASLVLGQHLGRVATDRPKIAGQVLMIPTMVHIKCNGPQLAKMKDLSLSSWETCRNAPILSRETCEFFTGLLASEKPDDFDLRINPGNASAEQVKGLPPTVVGVAGNDPLRDEGLLFAKMLAESGVPTDVHLFKGVPHGFRRFGEQLSECKRWDQVVERGILWALAGPEAGAFEIKTE
ncbi:Alpha/Beta hydrolase protein [Podospora aff. communis PSN243]|uniref:Alpha/Beta hydrolase protein n=1 Tax=Podospora aff. communis PSN243 TaxID=3040156 RepID=A0AAV9GG28_9PEZI|nr:Alpha/Beta hydrolase protein [Podospora aff. communis PSN243]